jgi:hypothetical protein
MVNQDNGGHRDNMQQVEVQYADVVGAIVTEPENTCSVCCRFSAHCNI